MRRAALLGWALFSAAAPAAAAEDVLPPQIVHEPCEMYEKGKPFVVVARFYDDSPIFDPKVVYRTQKIGDWKSASFTKLPDSDDFGATIKARDLKGKLEYFIETFDENGNGPARYGSPEAPVRVSPSDKPVECRQTGGETSPVAGVESSKGGPGKDGKGADKGAGDKAGADKGGAKPGGDKTAAKGAGGESKGEDKGGAASSANGGASAGGGQTVAAAPGMENGINTPPPPPAKTGCDAPDPPAYCSPILWTALGVGLVVLGGGGAALGVCFGTDLCTGSAPPVGGDEKKTLTIAGGSGSVTGALP